MVHDPVPGVVEQLQEDIRVVTAGNRGPMTYTGTRSYLLGQGDVALIDPGPDDADHASALHAALNPGERISHVFVTHAHLDHAPLARRIAEATGASVLGFGPAHHGRSEVMERLAGTRGLGGGEGIDPDFEPDEVLRDGDVIAGRDWELTALHTPGHLSNHMCFSTGDALFSGDHVMGWSTTLISPPDGDLTDFMVSLEKLVGRTEGVFYPGHGAPVRDPQRLVAHQIAHRKTREAQILQALSAAPGTPADLTARIYHDVDAVLRPAAARNVLAQLIDLVTRGLVAPDGALSASARFALTGNQID